jgi:hypothetical protein
MTRLKRTTRLTVETEGTFIFRARASRQSRWCEQCGAEVEMVFVDEAAIVSGLNEMTIYQSIAASSLHFAEDEAGRVLICLNSLGDQKLLVRRED